MLQDNHVKENSKRVWAATPAGSAFGQEYAKGSKEFFESVLHKRFNYECDWFTHIVNFKRFAGKNVLEIGSGAGYDAYMFCTHGAHYTGIDITPENKLLAEKHLGYYNLHPTLLCQDVEKINFKEKFDYVFSFGVLHHTPNIQQALRNIYKALKPGGEAQIIVYYKYSLFNLLDVIITKWIIKGGFLKRTLVEQRSLMEYTLSDAQPLVNVYSKKQLSNLMSSVGFSVIAIDVAKLVKDDLQGVFLLGKFARFIPQKLLTALGKKFGWYLSIRAIKQHVV